MPAIGMEQFAERLTTWQRTSGRHGLPWQGTRDPYRIWLSEIMLQQTQVAAVMRYYTRFLAHFPTLASLAAASEDAVLVMWSGLGYYARARNLHAAARLIEQRHSGVFPKRFEHILALPGIGRSTAGAIAVFAFGERKPILDGNVKRVFARVFGIAGFPGDKQTELRMWTQAECLLPSTDVESYTQGLMDLGAEVCVRRAPRCESCPLSGLCVARRDNLTALLPAPRPKKPLPEKSSVMLILRRDGAVLLEKRPAPGIWGGLWSFPEIPDLEDVALALQTRFGAEAISEGTLTAMRHAFTHYALTITPVLLRVSRLELRAQSPGQVWLKPSDAIKSAVPAPVRKLLRQLEHDT